MTAPYTLGMQITAVEGISNSSFLATFESSYEGLYLYQIYVGRTLAGVTESPWERSVVAQYIPSIYPEHLQLLAISPDQRNTDYGADLPDRPYNRVKLTFDTTGMDANTQILEVSAGTEPDGAVDVDNVIASEIYRGERSYQLVTEPLGPGGEWNFEVAGRDGTKPDGNRGDPLEISATIASHPPDVEPDGDGERFSVTADTGVLTIAYQLPEF